jgi:hypothetical protein
LLQTFSQPSARFAERVETPELAITYTR